jgi:hypothetical protein
MSKGPLEVQCPCCKAALKIDADTGSVLLHKEAERPKPIEDIGLAVKNLQGEAARREELFQKSLAEQKTRQSTLDKKFEELFKQASENPDEKPFRPDFDLD